MVFCWKVPPTDSRSEVRPSDFVLSLRVWGGSSRLSDAFDHYLIQRRFGFPCRCVVRVTDNSWELHAQLSEAPRLCAAVSSLQPESPRPVYYCYCCSPHPSLCAGLSVCVCVCVCVLRGGIKGLRGLLFATVTPAGLTLNIQQLSSMAPERSSNYRS